MGRTFGSFTYFSPISTPEEGPERRVDRVPSPDVPAVEPARAPEGLFTVNVLSLLSPHPTGGYDQVKHWPNGNVSFLLKGELHRVDGPAFLGADGSMAWLRHGRETRSDGPAVCGPDGEVEYWIDGHQVDPPFEDRPALHSAQWS